MNCIIIEDGQGALKHLETQLGLTGYPMDIRARIDSVEAAITWLKNNETDLIFLDIQLGDGLSFEIFDHIQVKTPVIFTTSFDQYLVKAFEVNSISYLLKPVKVEQLKAALDKYSFLFEKNEIDKQVIPLNQSHQKRFLVQFGSSIKSIPADEVAYLRVQTGRNLILVTRNEQQYLVENTLERLEQRLDPEKFFRINRQFIVHIDAIAAMNNYDGVRIKVETIPACKEDMIVSSKKIYQFKSWLSA